MIPLTERTGFDQLAALESAGGGERADEKYREKFNERLTGVAEAGDFLIARVASHNGSRLNFQAERLRVLGRILRRVIATAPEAIFSEEIQRFRTMVEHEVAQAQQREERAAREEQRATEELWAAEAEKKNIRELITEIESSGVRLSLSAEDDDKIICTGGNLAAQYKIWLRTRRRAALDVLRDREHAARVAEVV